MPTWPSDCYTWLAEGLWDPKTKITTERNPAVIDSTQEAGSQAVQLSPSAKHSGFKYRWAKQQSFWALLYQALQPMFLCVYRTSFAIKVYQQEASHYPLPKYDLVSPNPGAEPDHIQCLRITCQPSMQAVS